MSSVGLSLYNFWDTAFQSLTSIFFFDYLDCYLTIFPNNIDSYSLQLLVAKLIFLRLSHLNIHDSGVTPGIKVEINYQSSFVLKDKKINYKVSFNILVMVDISIFWDEPNEYFYIFLTPILFNSFIFNHSKIKRERTFRFGCWRFWRSYLNWCTFHNFFSFWRLFHNDP